MHAEAMTFLLLARAKFLFIYKGYLKTEFEFIHQQGCVNNFQKFRNSIIKKKKHTQ